jgi:colanic acid/amylovoran biosynthesis protein
MKKKILLIGQCTLHLGRMQYGNIGNFYILEPLVRYLRKAFPNSVLNTTFQLTKDFCKKEKINSLPMSLYYSWSNDDLAMAQKELEIAWAYHKTGQLESTTPYIKQVLESDLIVDFSGDIWGKNADLLGKNRFLVGLLKDRVAQLLGKKVAMIAGSPGPFNKDEIKKIAKETYANFNLVTNREPISTKLLNNDGFSLSKTKDLACPSFLFETTNKSRRSAWHILKSISDRPIIGFILCGWNFTEGPFDKMTRRDDEYSQFVELLEYISLKYDANICLMSHSNGFTTTDGKIKLIHGRDYPVIKKVEEILKKRGIAKNIFSLNGVYDPWTTKAIIGNFELLISGRIHGAIAALSQNIPTVILDYGHEPKAHKLRGFAKLFKVERYLADPSKENDMVNKFQMCWKSRSLIKESLRKTNPKVQKLATMNFEYLKKI